jgi:branched-chain amino acid transport system permease protein
LAVVAFFGGGGYITALLTVKVGISPRLGLPASMVGCAFLAFLLGFPTLRLRGVYFILMTLAFMAIAGGIVTALHSVTGGANGIFGIPSPRIPFPGHDGIDFSSTFSFYYLALGLMFVVLIVCYRMANTRTGLTLRAIRDTEILADSVGVNPFKYKMQVFIISSVMAAIAGWSYAHFLTQINPSVFAWAVFFDVIFMLIIGGIGTTAGPIVGAIFVTLIPEFLSVTEEYRLPIFSVLLIIVVVFAPRGLWPYLQERIGRLEIPLAFRRASKQMLD